MARWSLVLVLSLTVALPGCGTTSPQVIAEHTGDLNRPGLFDAPPRRSSAFGDWCDEHPVAATAGLVALVALGVGAVLVIGAAALVTVPGSGWN